MALRRFAELDNRLSRIELHVNLGWPPLPELILAFSKR